MNTFKILLRRLDFYLRNEKYCSPDQDYTISHSIDDLFEEEDDSIRTRIYWAIRRFWVNHWLCNPKAVWFDIVCAYQRMTRGWDDKTVWSIDSWLDNMMPSILRKLKEDKHGIPMSMFDGLPMNDQDYHDEPEMKIAEARWNEVLNKMIAGFEASHRVKELAYEDELGPYPLRRPKDVSKEEWKEIRHERFLACEVLRQRDDKISEEGLLLFAKHYHSLWD